MWLCRLSRVAAATLAFSLSVGPVSAQSNELLSAERDSVFLQMLDDPANTDLMISYARLSVQLRDYEAVVSTLERLVDQGAATPALRYELGIAYFALGSYELAEYHFDQVDPASLSAAQRVALDDYQRRTDRAQRSGRITGSISGGAVAVGSLDDIYPVGDARLLWSYDMGGATQNTWDTDLRGRLIGADSSDDKTKTALRLRTGPSIKAEGTAYGIRLRPYVELNATDRDEVERFSGALGAEAINPISEAWSVFADVQVGFEDRSNRTNGLTFGELRLGATYRPTRDTGIRASARMGGGFEDGSNDEFSLVGARRELFQRFDPGSTASSRDAELSAFVQADIREGGEDEGEQFSLGAQAKVFVYREFFIAADAQFITFTDGNNEEASDPIYGLRAGMEF